MLCRQAQTIRSLVKVTPENLGGLVLRNPLKYSSCLHSTMPACTELPRKLRRFERKPLVTSIMELKRKARRERKEWQSVREKILKPPENGLLVKDLIQVARKVYSARSELFSCVSKLCTRIAVYACRVCGEVHVGHPPHQIRTCNISGSLASKEHTWERGNAQHVLPVVESFHLYDRIGRAVSHNEQLQADRLPALVELCIQAGVEFHEYPTRRRIFPAYCVSGRIIDFEKRFPKEDTSVKNINAFGFWQTSKKMYGDSKCSDMQCDDIQGIAVRGMDAWERLRAGTSKLIQKYAVQTCGYCPEVQVGPKGHRVRNCQAYKHQMRDGQHAWQEATIDDLIPPVHAWHVRDPKSEKPLVHYLRRYYGKLPAAVELFAQAGAHVSDVYVGIMREDVAVPEPEEERLVV